MISPGCNAFRVLSGKQIGAHFKYFQIKTHAKTARESHDVNMYFRSSDKGFKQLCVTNFMQKYGIPVSGLIRLVHKYLVNEMNTDS